MLKRRPKDLLNQDYDYLEQIKLREGLVLVELETDVKKTGIMVTADDSPSGRNEFTYRGYVLATGSGVEGLEFGDMVYIDPAVDLRPEVNVSQTNVPKMIPNPQAPFFSFKTNQGSFWNNNVLKKKNVTVLLFDHQIKAKADGFIDV